MSYNSKLSNQLHEMQRLIKLFPSEFEAKYGIKGGSQVMDDPDYDYVNKKWSNEVSQIFEDLMADSVSVDYESELSKPRMSARTVKAVFYWGDRGGGKTTSMESDAQAYYDEGLSIWYLWGARSYENWFLPVSINCKKKWEKAERLPEEMQEQLSERLHCKCGRPEEAIPSVLVFPNYKEVDKASVLRFNGRYWKFEKEYKERQDTVGDIILYNMLTDEEKRLLNEGKLLKPLFLQPKKDMIKIAYITIPNDSDSRKVFKEEWIKIVTDARSEHRAVCVTPQIFEGDKDKFLVVGEIFKLLPDIGDEHFQKLTPEQVGQMRGVNHPVPEEEWTKEEKGWNKIQVILNELGSIAPNNKYSRQIESKNAKRPIIDAIPELRHIGSGIWFSGDIQNPDDLNSSVRPQANYVIVKRATKELLGDEFKPFFIKIAELRKKEFARWGYDIDDPDKEKYAPNEVKKIVNRKYPRIEELPKNKGYVVYRNGEFYLETFDMPRFHHRKEGESFRGITGITWTLNKKKLSETAKEEGNKKSKSDTKSNGNSIEKMVLEKLVELKLQKYDWEKGRDKILEMVEKGELPPEFASTKVTTLGPKSISKKIRRDPDLVKKLEGSLKDSKFVN